MIQAWYLEEGDSVMKGDEIAELTTEVGPFTVMAPADGVLAEVYYDEGESVERGEILCLIEDKTSSADEVADEKEVTGEKEEEE